MSPQLWEASPHTLPYHTVLPALISIFINSHHPVTFLHGSAMVGEDITHYHIQRPPGKISALHHASQGAFLEKGACCLGQQRQSPHCEAAEKDKSQSKLLPTLL